MQIHSERMLGKIVFLIDLMIHERHHDYIKLELRQIK